jgi:hypothetical protein
MKVLNIHKRVINQPIEKIAELLDTLASENDKMLAIHKWPRMKLDKGLQVGSKGGHGPIRYTVQAYHQGEMIEFKFSKPEGFNGTHKFEITELGNNTTEIKHTIDMNTSIKATLIWSLAVRWLHDAFIEDAYDKVENQFSNIKNEYKWNIWVRFLRGVLK